MIPLNTPVSSLNRVGKTTARVLGRLGIKTARDLLYYFPYRYDDYRRIVLVKELVDGAAVTVRVKLTLIGSRRSFRRRLSVTEALAGDDTGTVRLVWFNQPYIGKQLKTGDELFVSGVVEKDMLGAKFVSPSFEKIKIGIDPAHTARLVPVYALTKGITSKQIRFLLSAVIDSATAEPEWLPENILEKYDLVPIGSAIKGIHYPVDSADLAAARQRFKFDELLLIALKAELARRERSALTAPVLAFRETEIKNAVAALSFVLTKAQKIAAWEIMQDIARPEPMNRLLSGDVGSGKTVVAGLAIYLAALNNYQSAFMAPTEILARQHYDTIQKLFGASLRVGLLTNEYALGPGIENTDPPKRRRRALLKILAEGQWDVLIGTHALLTADVLFKNLALVVVDEQHRFGVAQRHLIKQKGINSHFLSMTATPIPRSLALVVYGDLDLSIIDELPPGRQPVVTRLVPVNKRSAAYDFVREQVKKGGQVFVVCPLIDSKLLTLDSSPNEKKTVLGEYEKLSKTIFPELSINYLHGKMPAKGGSASGGKVNKEQIMADFKAGIIQILVSTSVIEVGVDVPNASVMIIENADRFGLAQLHQFRGRVGRGSAQSYCLLFTDSRAPKTLDRLEYFAAHTNGFKLAEKDLEIRGPGEVYGTEQSGLTQLKFAKLTDQVLIKSARDLGKELIERLGDYPKIAERLREWEAGVHLE